MDATSALVVETPVPTTSRWIGVGESASVNSREAGVVAANAAIRGADTRLLIVFVSPAHDLQAVLAGIRSVAPETPLIGCSTAGEIATGGPSDSGLVSPPGLRILGCRRPISRAIIQ